MGFATTNNSIFAHKENIGVAIEKMQKNQISKFWS